MWSNVPRCIFAAGAMPIMNVRLAAILVACLLLLAGCAAPLPDPDPTTSSASAASDGPPISPTLEPTADEAASATPSISPRVEPTVDGFEFVTVDPDEYALAPSEQSSKLIVDWAERYCEVAELSPCTRLAERAVPLCIEKWDCHPALLVEFDEGPVAFVSGGIFPEPRVIAIWHPESDPQLQPYGGARKLLEAYLLSVGVCPDGGGGNPRGVGCPRL